MDRIAPTSRRKLDLACVALGAPLTALYSRVNVDDPFITFRYAWNLANGNGLVFNTGERVLGTTSPLFAVLLGLLSSSREAIPYVAHAASGMALIGVALLVSRFTARLTEESKPAASFVAPFFVLTSPLLAETQGFELNLFLLFALAGIAALVKRRAGWAGGLIAAAALFRGDGFLLGAMGGAYLIGSRSRDWRRFAIAFGLPAALFAVSAWGYYGAPLPSTLAAKRAMGESGLWRGYAFGGLRLAAIYVLQSPVYAVLVPVILTGLWRIWTGAKRTETVFYVVWAGLVSIIYVAMGIPSAFNYYGLWIPVLAILLGLGTHVLIERVRYHSLIVVVVIILTSVSQLWPSRKLIADVPGERYVAYRACAEQLAREIPPDATVAMIEIGILSHFSGVRILDLVGLVHPEIGPHLATGDVAWPVSEYKPEFVLLHDPPWRSIETGLVSAEWFDRTYTRQTVYEGPEPYKLVLYKRVTP